MLQPGGRLLLEAQPFNSYSRRKNLSVSTADISPCCSDVSDPIFKQKDNKKNDNFDF